MAQLCPLAIGRGALAVYVGARTLTGCKLGFAERLKQVGGAVMQRRGGVMDARRV